MELLRSIKNFHKCNFLQHLTTHTQFFVLLTLDSTKCNCSYNNEGRIRVRKQIIKFMASIKTKVFLCLFYVILLGVIALVMLLMQSSVFIT